MGLTVKVLIHLKKVFDPDATQTVLEGLDCLTQSVTMTEKDNGYYFDCTYTIATLNLMTARLTILDQLMEYASHQEFIIFGID